MVGRFSCFQGLEGVTLLFEVWVCFFGGIRLSEIPDCVKAPLGGLHWTHSRKTAEELAEPSKRFQADGLRIWFRCLLPPASFRDLFWWWARWCWVNSWSWWPQQSFPTLTIPWFCVRCWCCSAWWVTRWHDGDTVPSSSSVSPSPWNCAGAWPLSCLRGSPCGEVAAAPFCLYSPPLVLLDFSAKPSLNQGGLMSFWRIGLNTPLWHLLLIVSVYWLEKFSLYSFGFDHCNQVRIIFKRKSSFVHCRTNNERLLDGNNGW